MKFKEGDLVKIVKKPKNNIIDIVGKRGFVSEIYEFSNEVTLLYFQELINSSLGGSGSLPEDCVEICNDDDLFILKNQFDNKMNNYIKKLSLLNEKKIVIKNKYIEDLMVQFSIKREDIESLFSFFEKMNEEISRLGE
jgi:hypothetical protein